MNPSCAYLIVNSTHPVVLCPKLKSEGKPKTDNALLKNYCTATAVDNAEQICVWCVSPVVTRRSKTAFTRRGWAVLARRILVAESVGEKTTYAMVCVQHGMSSSDYRATPGVRSGVRRWWRRPEEGKNATRVRLAPLQGWCVYVCVRPTLKCPT